MVAPSVVEAAFQRVAQRDLLAAIREYEDDMRTYGYAAIRAALATRDQMLSTGAVGALTTRTWFRLCRTVPALRRSTFGHWAAAARPRAWEQTTR